VPKTGGLSLFFKLVEEATTKEETIKGFHGVKNGVDLCHLGYLESFIYLDDDLNSYKKYIVVRNPYDRLFSSFIYIISNSYVKEELMGGSFLDYSLSAEDFRRFVLSLDYEHLMDYGFVHIRPQHLFTHIANTQKIENIIKYVNYDRDLTVFLEHNGYSLNLDHINESKINFKEKNFFIRDYNCPNTKEIYKYIKFYDQDMICKVNKLYEKDFLFYGYKKILCNIF
jgi:hypothetical protein